MNCEIQDQVVTFNPDGTTTGKSGVYAYAYPEVNTILRKDASGDYRPIQQNIALPAEAQWGIGSVATSSDGEFSLKIARDDEQYPTGTHWILQLPDGKRYRGVPPNNAGPLSVHDLETSHGWVQIAGQVGVAGDSDGYEASGEFTLTGQDYYDVVFATSMSSSSYTINVGLQVDTSVGGAPGWSWSSRSQTGFRINLTAAYNGLLTWRAQVES